MNYSQSEQWIALEPRLYIRKAYEKNKTKTIKNKM